MQNGGSNIISSPPPSWRIDRHFVNKHGGLEGSYGQSFEIVENKKGKASTREHFGFIKENNGPELHVHVTRVPVDWY